MDAAAAFLDEFDDDKTEPAEDGESCSERNQTNDLNFTQATSRYQQP